MYITCYIVLNYLYVHTVYEKTIVNTYNDRTLLTHGARNNARNYLRTHGVGKTIVNLYNDTI